MEIGYFEFDLNGFKLQNGTVLDLKLAYQTYGTLNKAKDNVVLYPTYFAGTHMNNEWLIGKGKALIGSLLNIKPIATLNDGVYTPVGKARSHKQVVSQLYKSFKEETAGKIIRSVGISHANGLAMAEPLLRLLEESGLKDVKLSFTSPVISTHTGEGAIGFMYYTD